MTITRQLSMKSKNNLLTSRTTNISTLTKKQEQNATQGQKD